MLCAAEKQKDSCQGDSGGIWPSLKLPYGPLNMKSELYWWYFSLYLKGPLNCFNSETESWELCGIVSWGAECADPGRKKYYFSKVFHFLRAPRIAWSLHTCDKISSVDKEECLKSRAGLRPWLLCRWLWPCYYSSANTNLISKRSVGSPCWTRNVSAFSRRSVGTHFVIITVKVGSELVSNSRRSEML